MLAAAPPSPRLSDLLLEAAAASGGNELPQCAELLRQAAQQQNPLIAVMLDSGFVTETKFLQEVASRMGIPWFHETLPPIPAPIRERFPARIALRHHLFPLFDEEAKQMHIICYDPFNLLGRQVVAQHLEEPVRWHMATRRQILEALRQGYGVGADTFDEILLGRDASDSEADLRQETTILDLDDSEASVVKFVNQIVREALQENATDIHVEPLENDLRIRYRIDGVLHEIPVPSQIKLLQASVISRLKIMADLDIAERRLPQDGRINLEFAGRPIDVRVAVIPSVTGESISLRLLGQEKFNFQRLGLDAADEEKVRRLLAMPNGIVLLTGPTGCGKSTSLYTFLSSLNTKERRIVTIEDPVEQKLEGVIQIAVKSEINLTFANGLRSILRGDPNVVMVGEMRDFETAEIAIRAALTGHLVFSTLHTNDAIGGITRLIDMEIEPFLVASAVRAFIAQRLVRVLCPDCKVPGEYSEKYLRQIGFPTGMEHTIYKTVGCEHCRGTGYRGRRALMEICVVSDRLQEMITSRQPAGMLRSVALSEGMIPLRQDGWKKVIAGSTTLEEVVRVTTADLAVQDE